MWEIPSIDLSSLDPVSVPRYAAKRNRTQNQKAIKGALMASMLMIFMGVPVFLYVAMPIVHVTSPFLTGAVVNTVATLHSGQFLWFYLTHWRFPGFQDWVDMLVGLGLGFALSVAIATALLAAGWISTATAIAVLTAFLTPAGAIALAAGIAAW